MCPDIHEFHKWPFLKTFGILFNKQEQFNVCDNCIWVLSFSAAVCVQQYDEQFVHLFNLTMTQLKQVWINNKIDKSCSCNKFEKLDLCFFSWWQYCKIFMYCVDAAFGNKFERGLPERDRWWTKVYSELESLSVYIPKGTWPADWEEARLAHCPIRG